MQELLQQFYAQRDCSLSAISELAHSIANGTVPNEASLEQMAQELQTLRALFLQIRERAGAEAEDVTVEECAVLWDEKQKAAAKQRYQQLTQLFLAVCCVPDKEHFHTALEVQQAEAIRRQNEPDEKWTEMFTLFLTILQDGSYTDEDLDALDDWGHSRRLTGGLARGYYYLPAGSDIEPLQTATEDVIVIASSIHSPEQTPAEVAPARSPAPDKALFVDRDSAAINKPQDSVSKEASDNKSPDTPSNERKILSASEEPQLVVSDFVQADNAESCSTNRIPRANLTGNNLKKPWVFPWPKKTYFTVNIAADNRLIPCLQVDLEELPQQLPEPAPNGGILFVGNHPNAEIPILECPTFLITPGPSPALYQRSTDGHWTQLMLPQESAHQTEPVNPAEPEQSSPTPAAEPEPEQPAPTPVGGPEPEHPASAPAEEPESEQSAPTSVEEPEPEHPAPMPADEPEPEHPAPAPVEEPEPEQPAPTPAEESEPEQPAPAPEEKPASEQLVPEPVEESESEQSAMDMEELKPTLLLYGVPDLDPRELSDRMMSQCDLHTVPSDEEMLTLIQTLLAREPHPDSFAPPSEFIQGFVLAAACAHDPRAAQRFPGVLWLYRRLCPALHLPFDLQPYSLQILGQYDGDESEAVQAMHLACAVHAFLFTSNSNPDYYAIKSTLENLCADYNGHFPNWDELHSLFRTLKAVRGDLPSGFTDQILTQTLSAQERQDKLQKLSREAALLRDTTPKTQIHVNGVNAFLIRALGQGSDMNFLLNCVANLEDQTQENYDLAVEYLRTFCGGRVDAGVFEVEDELLIRFIQEGVTKERGDKFILQFDALAKVSREFKKRIDLLAKWLGMYQDSEHSGEIQKAFTKVTQALAQALERLYSREPSAWRNTLIASLSIAANRLRKEELHACFTDLLRTGSVPLDEEGMPVLVGQLYDLAYSQPWFMMLEHICADIPSLEKARMAVLELYTDNCVLLLQIERQLGIEHQPFDARALASMQQFSDEKLRSVRDKLEEACVFGHIDDNERERLVNYIDAIEEILFAPYEYEDGAVSYRDHGRWRHFLDAIQKNISDNGEIHRERAEKMLLACQKQQRLNDVDKITNEHSAALLEEIEKMVSTGNYAVAEEYIGLFQQNYRKVPDSFRLTEDAQTDFDVFLSEDVYSSLYSYCISRAGRGLRAFGSDWLEQREASHLAARMNRTLTKRNIDSGKRFLSKWPAGNGTKANTITALLQELGLAPSEVTRKDGTPAIGDVYTLKLIPLPKNKESYEHPIKFFGTTPDTRVQVVCLYGSRTANSLLSDVTRCVSVNVTTFVFLDFALNLSVRRQLSEKIREQQIGSHSPLIVVDRVLALFLSLMEQNERLRVMLSCTLPFAICQPFNEDKGLTADEMFAGRTRELNSIRSHNGACVVYGGRQLGKTALLHRAESLEHDPTNKRFAVYVDLVNLSEEGEIVKRIIEEISSRLKRFEVGLKTDGSADMSALCRRLQTLMRNGTIERFLLLLDETDCMLSAESMRKFHAIWPLYRLWKDDSGGKFKFVMAGLHNVHRTVSGINNQFDSPFGQMGQPLSISPLSVADAQLLLMRPLRYLGFHTKDEAVLKTILTYTCYYPGIIQFFGHKLVESVNGSYTRYYSADQNPPFPLAHEQLGAVMYSAELNAAIRHKINLTLELDPRYKLIACCVAWCYMMDSSYAARGCSRSDIRDVAEAEEIESLTGLSESMLSSLLDEMIVMGILVFGGSKDLYRFRRSIFRSVLGSDEKELEETIKVWKKGGRKDV